MTPMALLEDTRQHGVRLTVYGGDLRGKFPKGFLTPERKEAFTRHKQALIALLQPSPEPVTWVRTERGAQLLQPFWEVVLAAHRGELPAVALSAGEQTYEANDYVCRLSAQIFYGLVLDKPQLPDWLDSLQRIQEWWRALQAEESEKSGASAPV